MLPIGPLMIEHRLIERMIHIMEEALKRARQENRIDVDLVASSVRFIRDYADRCHHGKEEDILFRELEKKSLQEKHAEIVRQLREEHRWGRETTGKMSDALEAYGSGDSNALASLLDHMEALVRFYPRHIETEDRRFFMPVMKYFSDEEKDAMLEEGYSFDSRLHHESYEESVASWEGKTGFKLKSPRRTSGES